MSDNHSRPVDSGGSVSGKWNRLFAEVDASSLAVMRICFGLIMIWEVYRYFKFNRINRYWVYPEFNFTYLPFDFVVPLAGNGMSILFIIIGVISLFITVGLFYRVSMALFFVLFTYTFLLESANYLNHFYLICLIAFVMIFVPAHRSWSLDNRLWRTKHKDRAPAWSLWIMRVMVGIPYFFGGIAKITPDWLVGQPMSDFLVSFETHNIVGPIVSLPWLGVFMSWAGMLLDLLIVPALLWRRTRIIGFILITSFHLLNATMFNIGVFPWFMIGATTIFFSPSWPRTVLRFVTRGKYKIKDMVLKPAPTALSISQKVMLGSLAIWLFVQVALPFRHLAIPGNVHWTEEGHRWAWHMKLRSKVGHGTFTVINKTTGESKILNQSAYLTTRQIAKMSGNPYMIWQFCQMVKDDHARYGYDVAIYANVIASLNGRSYQQLIDPTVDMAAIDGPLIPPNDFVLPMTTPLGDRLHNF